MWLLIREQIYTRPSAVSGLARNEFTLQSSWLIDAGRWDMRFLIFNAKKTGLAE